MTGLSLPGLRDQLSRLFGRGAAPEGRGGAPPVSRLAAATPYVAFPLFSLAAALLAFRITGLAALTQAPLLSYDRSDAPQMLPLVKDLVENGTHWRNARLGAPGTFQLYDFPIVDYLHLATLWVLGKCSGSYLLAYNLYLLLTYPLTTLTALAVFRRLGLSPAAAGAGGLLYAFLHYHAARTLSPCHYFLAAYWVVPLSLWVVLRVCRGEPPLASAGEGGLRWSPRTGGVVAALAVAVLTALAGAYYAFFTCALLGFAGVYGGIAARSWKPPISAAVFVGLIGGCLFAGLAPPRAYHAEYGRNLLPSQRYAVEAELYGLNLAQLLMPPSQHQWAPLRVLGAGYYPDGRDAKQESPSGSLGLIGSAGVLGAGMALLLPGGHRWPHRPVAALIVFAIILAAVGGLGALFNYFVTPQIRAYNRMSVFIAFLGLLVALGALDGWTARWPRVVRWGAFALLAAGGILDQTPRPWFRQEVIAERQRVTALFAADAEFFGKVEDALPGGTVFALPHLPFPETAEPHDMPSTYSFGTAYLHTRTVRWSYGAMKGREVDQWLAEVAAEPADRMARRLVARDFDAVCVDLRGYAAARRPELLKSLSAACGEPALRHADGARVLFDLRPLRARALAELGPAGLAAEGARERDAVRLLFVEHFIPVARAEWAGRARAAALLVNPTDRPRAVRVRFRYFWPAAMPGGHGGVRITSSIGWDETLIGREGQETERVVTVPPGAHRVEFRARRPLRALDRIDPRACVVLREVAVLEP